MAEELDALLLAEEGQELFEAKLRSLVLAETDPTDSIIDFIRSIPGDDMAKKRALTSYFQAAYGSGYTREEKKAAYDKLLGAKRNALTIGVR